MDAWYSPLDDLSSPSFFTNILPAIKDHVVILSTLDKGRALRSRCSPWDRVKAVSEEMEWRHPKSGHMDHERHPGYLINLFSLLWIQSSILELSLHQFTTPAWKFSRDLYLDWLVTVIYSPNVGSLFVLLHLISLKLESTHLNMMPSASRVLTIFLLYIWQHCDGPGANLSDKNGHGNGWSCLLVRRWGIGRVPFALRLWSGAYTQVTYLIECIFFLFCEVSIHSFGAIAMRDLKLGIMHRRRW